jgi:hypothetical protein
MSVIAWNYASPLLLQVNQDGKGAIERLKLQKAGLREQLLEHPGPAFLFMLHCYVGTVACTGNGSGRAVSLSAAGNDVLNSDLRG